MQVLWSRTAQARSSCRCSQCLHAATGLARRTTTAASKRRVKIGDVVTALYSTVLASAALADSKIKEDRAREWDRVIAEAKEGKPLNELRPPGLGFKDNGEAIPTASVAEAPTSMNAHSNERWNDTPPPTTKFKWYEPARAFQSGPKTENIEIREVHDDSVVAQALPRVRIWGEGLPDLCDPDVPGIEPHTPHNFKVLENASADLVQKLLRKLSFFSDSDKVDTISDDVTGKEIQAVIGRFESLSDTFTRLPIYSEREVRTVERKRSELLQSLKSIMREVEPAYQGQVAPESQARVDLMLIKLSYNLLISTSPPNTKTYDLLLTEMSRMKRSDLVQDVVDAFWSSRLLPSKTTLALIIRHYTLTKNAEGLRMIRRKVLGVEDKTGNGNKCWTKDTTSRRVMWPNGSLSRPPMDTIIFDGLIRSYLEMKGGVRPAIRLMRSALSTGQKLETSTLNAAIRYCLDEKDFRAGVNLLMAILSPWITGAATIPIRFDGFLLLMIRRLLYFVGVDADLGSRGYLIRPLRWKKVSREFGRQVCTPREALDDMLVYMRVEALKNRVHHTSKAISVLSSLFIYRCERTTGDAKLELADVEAFREARRFFDEKDAYIHQKLGKGLINRNIRGRLLSIEGVEARLARLKSTDECLAMEIDLIKSIQMSAHKISQLAELLEHGYDSGIPQKRVEYLLLLIWLFQHQMAAISLQVGWMDTDNVEDFEIKLLHRSWKVQLLTDIEGRLRSFNEMYAEYQEAAGDGFAPLQLRNLPTVEWTSFIKKSVRSIDLTNRELVVMDGEKETPVEVDFTEGKSSPGSVTEGNDSVVIPSIDTALRLEEAPEGVLMDYGNDGNDLYKQSATAL